MNELWYQIACYTMMALGAIILALFAVGAAILVHERWKARRGR
jgi:predicted transporter